MENFTQPNPAQPRNANGFITLAIILLALGQAAGFGAYKYRAYSSAEFKAHAVQAQAKLIEVHEQATSNEVCDSNAQNLQNNGRRFNNQLNQNMQCRTVTQTTYQNSLEISYNGATARTVLSQNTPLPYKAGESFPIFANRANLTDVRMPEALAEANPLLFAFMGLAGSLFFLLPIGGLMAVGRAFGGNPQQIVDTVSRFKKGA